MAIKVSGTTVIDDSRNITNAVDGTFTGNVTITGTPTASNHAVTVEMLNAVEQQAVQRFSGLGFQF